MGVAFGLPPIPTPFRRLLNGGNDIAFYRCLRVGERVVAQATYEEVTLKHGRQAPFLLVVVATTFRTSDGELLLVNRQSLIWR